MTAAWSPSVPNTTAQLAVVLKRPKVSGSNRPMPSKLTDVEMEPVGLEVPLRTAQRSAPVLPVAGRLLTESDKP
jgi:hypothetical protein